MPHGPADSETKEQAERRLYSKCVPGDNGCLNFVGASHSFGYGSIKTWGARKNTTAHRLAWILAFGPPPEGMGVLHGCDNPRCVNLTHLRLGTQKDNAADMWERGRQSGNFQRKPLCKHGHPWTMENTRFQRSGRVCRACVILSKRRLRAERGAKWSRPRVDVGAFFPFAASEARL
jgi:hypothetical protein